MLCFSASIFLQVVWPVFGRSLAPETMFVVAEAKEMTFASWTSHLTWMPLGGRVGDSIVNVEASICAVAYWETNLVLLEVFLV